MNYPQVRLGISCCTSLLLCCGMIACSDVGTSVTSSDLTAAKAKPPKPPGQQDVSVYAMAITLEDRAGDAILSDGGGTYTHDDGALVELQAWETMDDQMYVKSAPGAKSRGGRLVLDGFDTECSNFQLRVYSSSGFFDVAVGETVFGTGLVMCTPVGSGMNKRYLLDIGECVAVHRIAPDAWRVACAADCVGRLSQGRETLGLYEAPFAFEGVLR